MNKKLVIFGTGKIAEVVFYYAQEECGFNVAGFCTDEEYKTTDMFHCLPVCSFETVQANFPPSEYNMFIAVGYHDLNRLRELKCSEAMTKGYDLVSIISPLANVPHNVTTGKNCFIMSSAIIHPYVSIQDNVFVWSGAMVGHHSVIGAHCWLTSSCNISGNVTLGANNFVGVNATIGHSVSIGKNCFLGANVLITKSLEDGKAVIAESHKPLRLTSDQFLRMSNFSPL